MQFPPRATRRVRVDRADCTAVALQCSEKIAIGREEGERVTGGVAGSTCRKGTTPAPQAIREF
jgi:hypothetical protein